MLTCAPPLVWMEADNLCLVDAYILLLSGSFLVVNSPYSVDACIPIQNDVFWEADKQHL